MAVLLCLETSTKTCSVALLENHRVLALKEQTDERYSHAEKLTLFIEEVWKNAGKKASDLDGIVVSKGPGSYTGLRIGTSTAKGLSYALRIPMYAISPLAAMAEQVRRQMDPAADARLIPMIDARRMEVYAAVYDTGGNELRPVQADIVEETGYSEYLNAGTVYFFGDGAMKCKTTLGRHKNARFIPNIHPSAEFLGKLLVQGPLPVPPVDTAYFEPFYLKDFVPGLPKKRV